MVKVNPGCITIPDFNKQNNIKRLLKSSVDSEDFSKQLDNASDKLLFFLSQGKNGRRYISRDIDLKMEMDQLA